MEFKNRDYVSSILETNEVKVARQSVRASAILFAGNLLSLLILVSTVMVIARLLVPEMYGEYTVALVLSGAFVLFTGFGMNTALMRYSAFHVSRGEIRLAKRKSRSASYMLVLLGAIFGTANFVGASFFSAVVLHRPELAPLVRLTSIAILGQAMIQASIAGFIGWASSEHASFSLIVQAALKLVLSPLFIVLGFSVFGAVLAHSLSYLLAGTLFFGIFYILKLRGIGSSSIKQTVCDVKEMISFGLPEYLGRVLFQFSQQSYLLIVLAIIATNITVAYYQAALNITVNLSMMSTVVAQALLPAFARLDGLKGDIRTAFTYAQKYSSYAMTPIIFFIVGTSGLLMQSFYGKQYLEASGYLQLLGIAFLPFAFGLAVLPPFFNGLGKTRLTLLMFLASSLTLFGLAPVLTSVLELKVIGLIISLVISNVVQLVVGMLLAKKIFGVTFQYGVALRSSIAAGTSYLILYFLTSLGFNPLEMLILSVLTFFGLYLTLAATFRIMSASEFNQLKNSCMGLGIVSKILFIILRYETFILKATTLTHQSSNER